MDELGVRTLIILVIGFQVLVQAKVDAPARSASLPINPHCHLSFHSLTTVVRPKNRSIVTMRKSKLRHVMSSVRLAICVETC